jgi:anti-sigma factor RsiW
MSHLGRRLSALIDGELGDTERDQVHAHLVSCDECRAEAAALRALKRRIRALGETQADATLTHRLIALGGLAEPAPPRARPHGAARSRAAWDVPGWFDAGAAGRGGRSPLAAGPLGGAHPAAGRGRAHTRYMVVGAVAALAVGLGAASFAAGGGEPLPGPTITPKFDVYDMEHAVMTGEMPLVPPHPRHPARQKALSARP